MIANTREEIEQIIQKLPQDTSIEEAMERLYLVAKIEKGLKQAESGDVVSHDQARKRLKKWLD